MAHDGIYGFDPLRSWFHVPGDNYFSGDSVPQTWRYAAADSFTIDGDWTDLYLVHYRLKLDQSSATKYFVVTGCTYDSGADKTTVTVNGGGTYTIANATIDNPFYSWVLVPPGFPATMVSTGVAGVSSLAKSGGTELSGDVVLSEGSGVTLTQTGNDIEIAASGGGSTPGYGTSLPRSPADGDEFILVDSTTLPTYQWRFRFNNGSSNTNKWEFIGGAPLKAEVGANANGTAETTTSTTFTDLSTTGPSVTVPRAGIYLISFGCKCDNNGSPGNQQAIMSVKIGSAATTDNDNIVNRSPDYECITRTMGKTLAASDVLKCRYRSTSSTVRFLARWITVVPIRVS